MTHTPAEIKKQLELACRDQTDFLEASRELGTKIAAGLDDEALASRRYSLGLNVERAWRSLGTMIANCPQAIAALACMKDGK
jgi:hypothetical protein